MPSDVVWTTVGWLWLTVFIGIVVVDFALGETAEYLQVYEVVRRSLAPGLPERSARFIVGQAWLGAWALPVAWLAAVVEAAVVAAAFLIGWRWWRV